MELMLNLLESQTSEVFLLNERHEPFEHLKCVKKINLFCKYSINSSRNMP